MEKRPPNFLTYLFGVTPPIRCYPLLRYGSGSATLILGNNAFVAVLGVPDPWDPYLFGAPGSVSMRF
jgi:hypothetical protein